MRPRGFRRFIIERGFHAVLLIANDANGTVMIVTAEDPVMRIAQVRKSVCCPVHLHRLWWLAGRPVSRRIVGSFKKRFADRCGDADWFDLQPSQAEAFIETTLRDIGTWGATDAAIIDFMRRHTARRHELRWN